MDNFKEKTLEEFLHRRISAIIRSDDKEVAAQAMEAAIAGGFRIVEFTLTTPGALELISIFSARGDGTVVGAGTVMTPQDAENSVKSGARFLVSPVCDPRVIGRAQELDVVTIPGTFTATEMATAHGLGADLVKLFPAPANLSEYIRFLLGPMPYLKIFPTSGVNINNMMDVLQAGAAGVGFVRSLFLPEDLASRNFTAIEERATAIVHLVESS
ncbi:MAG: bifunctional 4-hydroxy-2-oxoglutarate aldolase/2-dehydro-3-deoxy-phosphogluconate aldolase [Candidatus Neomarinimicrobiota bacterium]